MDSLLHGVLCRTFCIDDFSGKHPAINAKVKDLKDIIIRYSPQNNTWLLSNVLLDIINTEEDLNLHCRIEDELFIPAVKEAESRLKCISSKLDIHTSAGFVIYALAHKLVLLEDIK